MLSAAELKYLAKAIVRRALPPQFFYVWDGWRGKLNASETNVQKTFNYLQYMFRAAECVIADKQIIEVGSGRYARLGLRLVAAGAARVSLLDLYAVPLDDPRHREILENDFAELGLDATGLEKVEVFATETTKCDSSPLVASADVIFSISVFEHLRDPLAVHQKCLHWLKPGGIAIHSIDFRDHDDFSRPFEMLKFSESSWRRWLDPRGGCHLNRWRMNDHVEAAKRAGFQDVRAIVLDSDAEGLRRVRPRLHSDFAGRRDNELAALGALVIGRKPAAGIHHPMSMD